MSGRLSGKYDSERGKIIDPMRNMKGGDSTDAYATFVHEMQHIHLSCFTTIGQIEEFLQKEKACTPDCEKEHLKKLTELTDILKEAVSGIHEIYANTQELLWIEEYQGAEMARKVYERKSLSYQNYSKRFRKITSGCGTLDEKRKLVHDLCTKAANIPVSAADFAELLSDPALLKRYFEQEGNVDERLRKLMNQYEKDGKETTGEPRIDLDELIPILIQKGICVHTKELLLLGNFFVNSQSTEELTNLIEEHYQESMVRKVVSFDFAFAEENMKPVFDEWKERYFSVCCHSPNLLYPENNWMLMGCDEKGRYMGQEVSKEELQRALERAEILVVPFDEFDKSADRPEYFPWNGTPLFVIFQDFYQCERWLEDVLEEDLYVVDLYPKEVRNFYTMLFFRKRKEPDIVYVLPTLKYLAEKLPERLRQKVVFSEEQDSLKMFSCLGDEIQMMRAIQWLMVFLSGSEWENSGEQAASALSLGFVRSLMDSAMRIKRDEYWRYKSSLPTTETVSEGLYALMEFQGRENTGKMCSQEYQGKGCPMLFMKKEDAETCLKHRPQNEKWKLVAVDECYWKVLSEYLQTEDGKWCLYLNPNQGMILDVERYEQVLNWIQMRRAFPR